MKILWNGDTPWLLVRDNRNGTWEVVNGAWTLVWDGKSTDGMVKRTGNYVAFTHVTDVDPSKEDWGYSKILEEAKK